MAVVIAAATFQPERRMHLILIGPVKIIYIALVMAMPMFISVW